MTMHSDDTQESPVDKEMGEIAEEHLYTNLPWIKVIGFCNVTY